MSSPERITVELTRAEALVLFEYLFRCDDEGEYHFVDQAEERALWTLEGLLQEKLVEILSPDYRQLLSDARAEVRDPG